MLHLLPKSADAPSSIFSLIIVRLLTAPIKVLLCNLIKHADLAIELLDRRLVDTLRGCLAWNYIIARLGFVTVSALALL